MTKYRSINNIPLGKEEIDCLDRYIDKTYNINSIYYNILFKNHNESEHNIIVLVKKNNNYYTQCFYRIVFNNIDYGYNLLYPFEFTHPELILFPIKEKLEKNGFIDKNDVRLKIINLLDLPTEINDKIKNYFIKKTFNENSYFYIKPKNKVIFQKETFVSDYFVVNNDIEYGLYFNNLS